MKRAFGAALVVAALELLARPVAAAVTATVLEDGDALLSNGDCSLIIGRSSRAHFDLYGYPTANALGSIVALWPGERGQRSQIMAGSPVIRFAGRLHYIVYSAVEVEEPDGDDPLIVRAEASFDDGEARRRGRIRTTYSLRPGSGVVEIASTLTNTGEESFEAIRYTLHYDGAQFYPYETALYEHLHFQLTPKPGYYVAWVDRNRLEEGEPVAVDLAPGESYEVRFALVTDRDSEALMREVFARLGVEAEPVVIRFQDLGPQLFEVLVRDLELDSVVFRNFFGEASPLHLMLPPGRYSVTGNLFPAVVQSQLTVASGASAHCTLVNPPRGRVRVAVKDRGGESVPGKVTFIGVGETSTPYFTPHDPVRGRRSWEEVKNSVHPVFDELEVAVPVGRYRVTASRGPEYSLQQVEIEVRRGGVERLDFELERVVETDGLAAVDTHMHTLRSDGAVDERERVLSLVGEGVEVAVPSDHFLRNDYTPEIEALRLRGFLKVIPGSEISIRDPHDYEYTLDFGLYPLGPGEGGWEARATLSEEVAPIFEETRRLYPDALIQLNHPRNSSWDYFVSYRLDPGSAASARGGFSTDFDVLEILNGPSPAFNNNAETIRDWMHLMARGLFFPAVASSDSHQIDTEEPGYSRTYVYVDDRDLVGLDIGAVIRALKEGRSFVTNGPIVEVTANERFRPGDVATVSDGTVELRVEVRTAPWVVATEARVVVNGSVADVLTIEENASSRLGFRVTVPLVLERDAFVLVEVVGRQSLYPVVQASSVSADGSSIAVMPYALTNPIFIDVDGNGRFDAPLPGQIRSSANRVD